MELPHFVKDKCEIGLGIFENRALTIVTGVRMGLARRVAVHCSRRTNTGPVAASKPIIMAVSHRDLRVWLCPLKATGHNLGYYQEMHDEPRMSDRVVVLYQPEGSKEMRASMWGTRLEDGIVCACGHRGIRNCSTRWTISRRST